jgi:uncharacterized membrane protein YeaQ/YmgE (transglycosylase-associated protein family)
VLGAMMLGIVGAVIGGFVAGVITGEDWTTGVNISTIIVSVIGALLALVAWNGIARRSAV